MPNDRRAPAPADARQRAKSDLATIVRTQYRTADGGLCKQDPPCPSRDLAALPDAERLLLTYAPLLTACARPTKRALAASSLARSLALGRSRALAEAVPVLGGVNARVLPVVLWTYVQAIVADGYGPLLTCRFLEKCLWHDLADAPAAAAHS